MSTVSMRIAKPSSDIKQGKKHAQLKRQAALGVLPSRSFAPYPVDYRISRPDYRFPSGKPAILRNCLQKPIRVV